ncbi:MAG: hypothetical protein ABSE16_21395 [Verrucomicrobiota bacterium]
MTINVTYRNALAVLAALKREGRHVYAMHVESDGYRLDVSEPRPVQPELVRADPQSGQEKPALV